MKKSLTYILYIVGLLCVNVLVRFAAMLAFLLFLFRGDPILAAVPAVFALPAIVLQPWFLVIAGGFVLLAVSVAVAKYVDFPALNHGLPPSVQFLGLSVTESRYYCLNHSKPRVGLRLPLTEPAAQARKPTPGFRALPCQLTLRRIRSGRSMCSSK